MKRFLSGLKLGRWTHNKKLKTESKPKDYYWCISILCVTKESLQANSPLLKINQLTCKNKIPATDYQQQTKSHFGQVFLYVCWPFAEPLWCCATRGECKPTFRRGLSLVSMMKSYLQSSQQRVSELLIHWCRQAWWTKRSVPVQRHGVIRGLSSSPSQWQILPPTTATHRQAPRHTPAPHLHCFLSSSLDIQKLPRLWPFRWRPGNIFLVPLCRFGISLPLVISLWICYMVWRWINRNNSFSLLCIVKPLRQIPERNSSWSVSNANKILKGREI